MEENTKPSVKERLQHHIECCVEDERFPVVFCVKCGSTHIDQNFLTELRCYECGNTLAWDGSKFGINRYAADQTMPGRFDDAKHAFQMENNG